MGDFKEISIAEILRAPLMNVERLAADIGKLMVLAPHPDDESLGCGGLIALLREAQSEVSVVFITDGTASHSSNTHPPKVLAQLRESEAIKACNALGIPEEDVLFLRKKDSKLNTLDASTLKRLQQEIVRRFRRGKFKTLAIPWRRDPHPDHIAVYNLGVGVAESLSSPPVLLEYPIWLWKNGTESDWPRQHEILPYRLDIASVKNKKLKAIEMHKSQLGKVIFDDINGFVLTDDYLEPFRNPFEHYFVVPNQNKATLSKDYFTELYENNEDPWNFRNSRYETGKYKACLDALGRNTFPAGLELGCSVGIQTKMLAKICGHLKAVDISEIAVREASIYCKSESNVKVLAMDISAKFPLGNYDLITCCELGYYFKMEDLLEVFQHIHTCLNVNGKLLLVHWTPFVPDYPLSGDAVHDSFQVFASKKGDLRELVSQRKERYRLQVWQKS